MTSLQHHQPASTHTAGSTESNQLVPTQAAGYALGVLRIGMGWTFLWAFLDKAFALGYGTGRSDTGVVDRFGDAAWIHGGSPTAGFLGFAATGPFQGFYNSIAGTTLADWGFMLGCLAIGVAFTFGISTRLATIGGALMYVLMWTVTLPPPQENNPITDDHVIGLLIVLVVGLCGAGHYLGLGSWWDKQSIVKRFPILK